MGFSSENTLHLTVLSIGLIASLVSSAYFFTRKTNRGRNLFLALFLLSLNAPNFQWIVRLSNIFQIYPNLACLPVNFHFAIGPFLYLYMLTLLNRYSKIDLWHLLPGVIAFLVEFRIMFLPIETIMQLYKNPIIDLVFNHLVSLSGITYSILVIIRLRMYRELLPNFYSSLQGKKLHWLEVTAYICLVIFVWDYTVLQLLRRLVTYRQGLMIGLVIPTAITLFIPIFAIRYHKLSQSIISLGSAGFPLLKLPKLTTSSPQNGVEENTKDQRIYDRIEQEFVNNKIHTNPDLSLFVLADELHLSYKDISRVINTIAGENFNYFVNGFRVNEAKKLLLDKSKDHFDLTGISELAGFSSRSTFFTHFKEREGITPSAFKKKNT